MLDQPGREGNYLEATCSAMFTYSLLRGVRLGLLDESYRQSGLMGYNGMLKQFVKTEKDGTVSLANCCAVAGLGGDKNYRSGDFDYYVSELVRDNDAKGVGPFIMACLEMEQL